MAGLQTGRPSGRLVRKFRKLLCVNAKGVPELENVGNPMLGADRVESRKYLAIPGSWHSRRFPRSRELQNYNKSLYFMIEYYIYRISLLFLYIYMVACIILKFSRILKLGGESRITRYFREPHRP